MAEINLYSQVKNIRVSDNSETSGDFIPEFSEISVLEDYSNISQQHCEMFIESFSDSFKNICMVCLPGFDSSQEIGGYGSRAFSHSGMDNNYNDFRSLRAGPKTYFRDLTVEGDLESNKIPEVLSGDISAYQNISGQNSSMVFDYFPSSSDYNQYGAENTTIIGTRTRLLKITYQESIGMICESYSFSEQKWIHVSDVIDRLKISRKTNLSTDKSDNDSSLLTYNTSPSAYFDSENNRVVLCVTNFSYKEKTIKFEVYESRSDGDSWSLVSEIISGFDFEPQNSVLVDATRPNLFVNNLLFVLRGTSIVTNLTVEFTDTVLAGNETATLTGNQLVIEIESGVSTLINVFSLLMSTTSVTNILSVSFHGTITSPVFATEELSMDQNRSISIDGVSSDNVRITGYEILGYTSLSNRTRISYGSGRFLIVAALVYRFNVRMDTVSSSIESTQEYHCMTWHSSTDDLFSWDRLPQSRVESPASPLTKAVSQGLAIGLGSRGRYRSNLFDLFSNASGTSYYESVTGDITGNITNINYSVSFALYFDSVMQEFVVAKRSDGDTSNRNRLVFIRTDGYRNFSWVPVLSIALQNEIVDDGYEGSYTVNDISIQEYNNDLNYMAIEVNDNLDNSNHIVLSAFKFLNKKMNSYSPDKDMFSIDKDKRTIYRGIDYYLMMDKVRTPNRRIQPNPYCSPDVEFEDKYEIKTPIITRFKESLVCLFYPIVFNGLNDIPGICISNSWQNFYEERPYRIVEIPYVRNNSGNKLPNTTHLWTITKNIASPDPSNEKSHWEFYVAGTNPMYVYYRSFRTTNLLKSSRIKIKTRIKIEPEEGQIPKTRIEFLRVKTGIQSISHHLAFQIESGFSTSPHKIRVLDINDSGPSILDFDLDGVTGEKTVDLVIFLENGLYSSNIRIFYKSYENTDSTFGSFWYRVRDESFTPVSGSSINYNEIDWGILEDDDATETFSVNNLGKILFYFFCYSELVSSTNPYQLDRFLSREEIMSKDLEGFTAVDFKMNNRSFDFGRKISESLLDLPCDYSISFCGSVGSHKVFLIGSIPNPKNISKIFDNFKESIYRLPSLIGANFSYEELGGYQLKLRFDSMKREGFSKILFSNTIIQNFRINFFLDYEDEEPKTSLSSNHFIEVEALFEGANGFYSMNIISDTDCWIVPEDMFVVSENQYFEILYVVGKTVVLQPITLIDGEFIKNNTIGFFGEKSARIYFKNFSLSIPELDYNEYGYEQYFSFEIICDDITISLEAPDYNLTVAPYQIGSMCLGRKMPASNVFKSISINNPEVSGSNGVLGQIIYSSQDKNKAGYTLESVSFGNKNLMMLQRLLSAIKGIYNNEYVFLEYISENYKLLPEHVIASDSRFAIIARASALGKATITSDGDSESSVTIEMREA